ncbi:MAG: peptide chain release factor N(5)-glutamine methyltransferase [Aggregatilineales bacterium]
MTTLKTILKTAKARLQHASPSASLDADLLLCHVLDVGRTYLVAYDDRILTPDEIAAYETLLQRREAGEPIAYIRGYQPFYDRDFIVTADVLIPRPETEHLLETALDYAKTQSMIRAVDVGTGSGILAVTFAAHTPDAEVHAIDISPAALTVARQNADKHDVQIQFHEGNLAAPLLQSGQKFNLIMANLPYIASDEIPDLAVSQHEPHLALDGGGDGLRLIETLLEQCVPLCDPGAMILLEIGYEQGAACIALAEHILSPQKVDIIKDLAGHDRIVRILY